MIVYVYETIEGIKEVTPADQLLIHQTNIKKCLFLNMTENTYERLSQLDKGTKDLYVDSVLDWDNKERNSNLNNK